jgi:hypothetical protein
MSSVLKLELYYRNVSYTIALNYDLLGLETLEVETEPAFYTCISYVTIKSRNPSLSIVTSRTKWGHCILYSDILCVLGRNPQRIAFRRNNKL